MPVGIHVSLPANPNDIFLPTFRGERYWFLLLILIISDLCGHFATQDASHEQISMCSYFFLLLLNIVSDPIVNILKRFSHFLET